MGFQHPVQIARADILLQAPQVNGWRVAAYAAVGLGVNRCLVDNRVAQGIGYRWVLFTAPGNGEDMVDVNVTVIRKGLGRRRAVRPCLGAVAAQTAPDAWGR